MKKSMSLKYEPSSEPQEEVCLAVAGIARLSVLKCPRRTVRFHTNLMSKHL